MKRIFFLIFISVLCQGKTTAGELPPWWTIPAASGRVVGISAPCTDASDARAMAVMNAVLRHALADTVSTLAKVVGEYEATDAYGKYRQRSGLTGYYDADQADVFRNSNGETFVNLEFYTPSKEYSNMELTMDKKVTYNDGADGSMVEGTVLLKWNDDGQKREDRMDYLLTWNPGSPRPNLSLKFNGREMASGSRIHYEKDNKLPVSTRYATISLDDCSLGVAQTRILLSQPLFCTDVRAMQEIEVTVDDNLTETNYHERIVYESSRKLQPLRLQFKGINRRNELNFSVLENLGGLQLDKELLNDSALQKAVEYDTGFSWVYGSFSSYIGRDNGYITGKASVRDMKGQPVEFISLCSSTLALSDLCENEIARMMKETEVRPDFSHSYEPASDDKDKFLSQASLSLKFSPRILRMMDPAFIPDKVHDSLRDLLTPGATCMMILKTDEK